MSDKKQSPSGDERPTHDTDISQIDLDEAVEKPFSAEVQAEYRVMISKGAFEEIKKHAASDTTVELGGVLAGNLCKDADGPYLDVRAAIPGAATRRTGSQVTFTHETWEQIHKEMEKHPDERVVGWYHTHPGFGVFLSEMDQFIQDNFFNLPHQVAFVYDPSTDEHGLYVWRKGDSARLRRYWLAGELCYDLTPEAGAGAEAMHVMREAVDDDSDERQDGEYQPVSVARAPQDWMPRSLGVWALAGVVALLAAFWLGGMASRMSSQESQDRNKALETLVRAGVFRDGLGLEMQGVADRLNTAWNRLRAARSALPEDADTTKAQAELDSAVAAIREASSDVAEVRQLYTSAGRLAQQMDKLTSIPDELTFQRSALVSICVLEAQQALAAAQPQAAMDYRSLAIRLAPQMADQINRLLPELAPKPPAVPPAEEKKE